MQSLSLHNSITKEIAAGSHAIKYALPGYKDVAFNISVVGGVDKTYHKTLTALSARFDIVSMTVTPTSGRAGASITVNLSIRNLGNLAAPCDVWGSLDSTSLQSKKTFSIAAGGTVGYNYIFTVPNINAGGKTLKISVGTTGIPDDTYTLPFTVLKNTAMITFDSTPKGAKVYVNGTLIGNT